MTDPPKDFIGAVNAGKAADAAREAALAPPPRPHRATNKSALDAWLQTMVSGLTEDTHNAPKGEREVTLNNAALRIGGYVHLGVDRQHAERELFTASEHNGWVGEEGANHVRWKIRRAIEDGMNKPNERPDLDAETVVPISTKARDKSHTNGKKADHSKSDSDEARTLKLRKLSTVKSRVPMWVWEYGDKGRIQLGTLSMFAGKPSAGKSTAVRWFAARLSRGELDGVWHGHPMKVTVVMAEEQTDAVVVPGLVAAGADMTNLYTPEIKYGDMESGLKVEDIAQLREELLDNQVRALFVDPIMSTFSGKADIYRNNEVREALAPFVRLAKDINGIVVGVTHLRKGDVRDVLGSINGSGAFGEVPRAVFGFAPIEAGQHVMEQVKNSAGAVGLRLTYELPIEYMTADDGQPIDLPRFQITGESELSIADLGGSGEDQDATTSSADVEWLRNYLRIEQPAPSARVKQDAKQQADISESRLHRARKRLAVRIINHPSSDKPHQTAWSLPDG